MTGFHWARRGVGHWALVPTVCLLAVAAALWPLGAAQAAPILTVEPERGPCPVLNPPIVVRGSGFRPGMMIKLLSRRATDGPLVPQPRFGETSVAADGTFSVQGQLFGCAPGMPDGTQFVIEAVDPVVPPGAARPPVVATATFTVSSSSTSPPSPPGLPNTGGGGARPWTPQSGGLLGGAFLLAATVLLCSTRPRRRVR